MKPPTAENDLGNETANAYFKSNGPFIPTDVEYLNGLFYITTGYSKLDYVLTAKVKPGPGSSAPAMASRFPTARSGWTSPTVRIRRSTAILPMASTWKR